MYVGGTEHATRHLIYARFWHKFLYDIGVVSQDEPFTQLRNQGLILAEDGRKMSKRWGNVINPDEIVDRFGADSLRFYEMFMGPFGDAISWNADSLVGVRRFIEKVWRLPQKVQPSWKVEPSAARVPLDQTIKKVSEDIENFKFNTAVSALMILMNAMDKETVIPHSQFLIVLKLLAPFAPHLAEELWQSSHQKKSIYLSEWPSYDPTKLVSDIVTMVVSVNGRVRDTFQVERGAAREVIEKEARERMNLKKWLPEEALVKVIYVPDRLVNFVLTEKA